MLITSVSHADAQSGRTQAAASSVSRRALPSNAELARLRADMIQKMRESRAALQKLLAVHEENSYRLALEYEKKGMLLSQGLISQSELRLAGEALEKAIRETEQVKRWIREDDVAITEASMRDELLRLPALGAGGFSESATLVRFNGTALWSLAAAPKIEQFFTQMFRRPLPISAFGQTATHDRLRFDHRNAMDVALHPDSREGQSLIAYLRQSGIPFIAFRGAVPGAATGAHIHIGQPSPRN